MQFDFRQYLLEELAKRCTKNPKYSLRAFAKTLYIHPATLSHYLRKKRDLPVSQQLDIAMKLGIDSHFIQALIYNYSKTKILTSQVLNFDSLSLDQFSMISDWYHFAILELIQIQNFKENPRWIAKVLGVSVNEIHAAVERLFRLGMIVKNKSGKWILNKTHNSTVSHNITTPALKKLQKQFLELALRSLEETPYELRDQSGMTLSINVEDLPEVKNKIKKFRRELCEYLEKKKVRNSVYQLSISFFPLVKTNLNIKREI